MELDVLSQNLTLSSDGWDRLRATGLLGFPAGVTLLCPQGGEPVRPGVAMTDLATGLYAHGAIMAALLQQQRTGRGSHIDCNLLSSQVSWFPPPADPDSNPTAHRFHSPPPGVLSEPHRLQLPERRPGSSALGNGPPEHRPLPGEGNV